MPCNNFAFGVAFRPLSVVLAALFAAALLAALSALPFLAAFSARRGNAMACGPLPYSIYNSGLK
jgi:hypothetical protein